MLFLLSYLLDFRLDGTTVQFEFKSKALQYECFNIIGNKYEQYQLKEDQEIIDWTWKESQVKCDFMSSIFDILVH